MQADRRTILGRYLECKPEQVHTTELKEDYIILVCLHSSHKHKRGCICNSYARQKVEFYTVKTLGLL